MLRAATLPRAWMAALRTVRVSWRSSLGVIGMTDHQINILCIFTHKVELGDLLFQAHSRVNPLPQDPHGIQYLW
ncbi:hypothetical protein D3C76_1535800 [compost metagenome]